MIWKLRARALVVSIITLFALGGSLAAASASSASPALPPQLAGQWGIPWNSPTPGGTEFMTLADSHFTFVFNHHLGEGAVGDVSVSGDTITFGPSQVCNGTGTYQWSLSADDGLTFVQVAGSSDPCQREPILVSGTWTRR